MKDIEPTNNPDENTPHNDPPLDDSGINNDHILDLCDFVIKNLWIKFVGSAADEPQPKETSVRDMKDIAYTLQSVWTLAQDIIELDRRLRYLDDDLPPGFYNEGDEPQGPMIDEDDE